jgi:biopolymer transport protein ExbD
MSGLYIKRRKRPELNLVPLIDVLVMLIFFSFVTMQFRSVAAMNLTLPRAESAGKNDIKDSVTITITKDGSLFINNTPVKSDELAGALQKIAAVRKEITVLVRADETSQLKYAIEVMDVCNKNGLSKVRVQLKNR